MNWSALKCRVVDGFDSHISAQSMVVVRMLLVLVHNIEQLMFFYLGGDLKTVPDKESLKADWFNVDDVLSRRTDVVKLR